MCVVFTVHTPSQHLFWAVYPPSVTRTSRKKSLLNPTAPPIIFIPHRFSGLCFVQPPAPPLSTPPFGRCSDKRGQYIIQKCGILLCHKLPLEGKKKKGKKNSFSMLVVAAFCCPQDMKSLKSGHFFIQFCVPYTGRGSILASASRCHSCTAHSMNISFYRLM